MNYFFVINERSYVAVGRNVKITYFNISSDRSNYLSQNRNHNEMFSMKLFVTNDLKCNVTCEKTLLSSRTINFNCA